MIINRDFIKNAGIDPAISADLSFVVLDTTGNASGNNIMGHYNPEHSKSRGSVQSILEMHMLMTNSLAIVHPMLVFSPDFPEYLLPEDDPKFVKTLPTLNPDEYKDMPHFRHDLLDRSEDEYATIENLPAPHITWGLVRQEPGTVSSAPFSGTQEIKPRERELVLVFDAEYKSVLENHSDNLFIEKNGKLYKYIKVKGQFMDNLVQYNIWSRSNWEVEELADWFQRRYMLPYTGMFREAGVNNLYFTRRMRDDTIFQMKNNFHVRSMLYYIRTEHIYNDTIMPISRIDVDINTITSTNELTMNDNLSNYYNRILDKWHFNKNKE